MDALAEKIEVLTERVAEAEKRLAEKCSCEKWASCFGKKDEQPQKVD
jgi:hypothetical protein